MTIIDPVEPDGTISQSGWNTYAIGNIDTDDATWQDPSSNTADAEFRLSFPTPSPGDDLTEGATDQVFEVKARKFETGQGGTPTIDLEVWETGGALPLATVASQNLTGTEATYSMTWDANILALLDGSGVEIRVVINKAGGSPANRASGSVQYVKWIASVKASVDADTGNFPWAGTDASFDIGVPLETANFPWAGTDATFEIGGAASANLDSGNFPWDGTAATFGPGVVLDSGNCPWDGTAATFDTGFGVSLEPGAFVCGADQAAFFSSMGMGGGAGGGGPGTNVLFYETFTNRITPVVGTRADWSAPWVPIEHLYCEDATRVTGTGISQATLSWEYGRILDNDTGAGYVTLNPLDLLDRWVRIEWQPDDKGNFDFLTHDRFALVGVGIGQIVLEGGVAGTRYGFLGPLGNEPLPGAWVNLGAATFVPEIWYGVITDSTLNDHGGGISGGIRTGTQTFTAYGLEWLLTREQIRTTFVNDNPSPGGPATPREINLGIPFNEASGRRIPVFPGNRDPDATINGTPLFAREMDGTNLVWNSQEILDHLLEFHAPVDLGPQNWILDASATNKVDWEIPINLETHGRTMFELINELLPRQRGIIWWLSINETFPNEVRVMADTVSEVDIPLPGTGGLIPANNLQVNVVNDFDESSSVSKNVTSTQREYDQIIVEGARRGAIVTMRLKSTGPDADGITEDWEPIADLVAYRDAASVLPGYGPNDDEKERQNDTLRTEDSVLKKVFTHYAIAYDWAYTVKDDQIAYLQLDSGGIIIIPEMAQETWNAGIRVENYLPLWEGFDYTDPTNPVDNNTTASSLTFQRPFAAVAPDPMVSSGTKRIKTDNLVAYVRSEGINQQAGAISNFQFEPHDHGAGFRLRGSAPGHLLGYNFFQPLGLAGGTDAISSTLPRFDHETLLATFYMTFPDNIRIVLPNGPPRHNHISRLLIRLGDRAHHDYIPTGTIIGFDSDNEPIETTTSGLIRDDTDVMYDIATVAGAWYRIPRRSVQLSVRNISSKLFLGMLINRLNNEIVNCNVTGVSWNFTENTTSITTAFTELDFGAIFFQGSRLRGDI